MGVDQKALEAAQKKAEQESHEKKMRELEAQYEANIKLQNQQQNSGYSPIANASYKKDDGSWERPTYQSLIDPETGLLKDNFQLENTLNTQGLEQYRSEALRDPGSESAWLQMALESGELDRIGNQNNLSAQLNSGTRSAMDNLAAQGGLDSGSRLSVARGGLRDFMRGKQEINAETQRNNLGLRTTDEENRLKMLSALPGMELQKSGFDADLQQKNIEGAMNERRYTFDNEMDAWTKNQEVWGANKQADAQRASSGGCFEGETLVEMADGEKKAIKDIKLGDQVLLGGKVLQVLQGLSKKGDDWYTINGVHVSGSHLVLESGEWVPARSFSKRRLAETPDSYFNLTTQNHILFINDQLFSDMQDVDDYELCDVDAMIAKNRVWKGADELT